MPINDEERKLNNGAGCAGDGENKRVRVKQLRKRSVSDKAIDAVKADRLSREPLGLKIRKLPKAENRTDGILSAIAVVLGLIFGVCFFLFFMGIWPPAGYVMIAAIAGILLVGAIDFYLRKSVK